MPERSTVSVDEIAKRLHFTRNHIYKAMLPYIKHEKIHNRIQVDEADLRQWLMDNASFSRQTKFVDAYDEPAWREYIAMLESCGLDLDNHHVWSPSVCPPPAQRSKLPFRSVHPFDFWDEELVFPDDPRFNNAESFYRTMYESAAIKIKLGERKTIFCAPALNAVLEAKEHSRLVDEVPELGYMEPCLNYVDINSFTGKKESFHVNQPVLYPAIDAEKEEEYYRQLEENHPPVVIRIEGRKACVEKVREALEVSGIYTYSENIEESLSASGNTLCLKIPETNINYWSNSITWMKQVSEKYGDDYEQDLIFPDTEDE